MKASRYAKAHNGKNCEVVLMKKRTKPKRSKRTGRFIKK